MANQQSLNRLAGGFNVQQRVNDRRQAEMQNLLAKQMQQSQIKNAGLRNQLAELQLQKAQQPQGPKYVTQGGYQYQVDPNTGQVIGPATAIQGLPGKGQSQKSPYAEVDMERGLALTHDGQVVPLPGFTPQEKPKTGTVKANTDLAQYLPESMRERYLSGELNDSAMLNLEVMGKQLQAKSEAEKAAEIAAAEEAENAKFTERQDNAAKTNSKAFSQAVDRAFSVLKQPLRSPTTGVGGRAMSLIDGSQRKQLEGALTTMKAKISFETLNAMRKASKTGGALGSVSAPELDMLQASLGSIDLNAAANDEDLMRQIAAAEKLFNEVVHGPDYVTAERQAYTRPSIGQSAANLSGDDGWEIL